MSRFLGYEACPKCRDRGGDRAGDNLALYADGGKHCFAIDNQLTIVYNNKV
jgi:hypothetical protein